MWISWLFFLLLFVTLAVLLKRLLMAEHLWLITSCQHVTGRLNNGIAGYEGMAGDPLLTGSRYPAWGILYLWAGKQCWGRLKHCFLGLTPRPRITSCAGWSGLSVSCCTARNCALSGCLGGVGTREPHKLMVKKPLLPVSEIWSQSLTEASGDFSHSFLQGKGILSVWKGRKAEHCRLAKVSKPSWLKWSLDNAATPVK